MAGTGEESRGINGPSNNAELYWTNIALRRKTRAGGKKEVIERANLVEGVKLVENKRGASRCGMPGAGGGANTMVAGGRGIVRKGGGMQAIIIKREIKEGKKDREGIGRTATGGMRSLVRCGPEAGPSARIEMSSAE